MYFLYLGFHDVVPILFMRLCTVTLLLLLNVLKEKKSCIKNQK